jgi:hypothetical protein
MSRTIERQIQILKEHTLAIRGTLPFKAIPERIVIELVYYASFGLSAFPPSKDVSDSYSPRTIMTCTSLEFSKYCKLPFGAYAEAYEEYPQTNTMDELTHGVIYLGPTRFFKAATK